MADAEKAQKLASARKKFKELKKEKKKNAPPTSQSSDANTTTADSAPASREQTPIEFSSSASQSETGAEKQDHALPNYFSNAIYNRDSQQTTTASFFDNLTNIEQASTNVTQNNFFNNFTNPNTTSVSKYFNKDSTSTDTTTTESDALVQSEAFNPKEPSQTQKEIVKAVEEAFIKPDEEDEELKPNSQLKTGGTPQRLVQGLQEFINNSTPQNSQLELENQELKAQLAQERIKIEQLNAALTEYQAKIVQLESDVDKKEEVFLQTGTNIELELSKMREEARCHSQTVDILVGQKTELENSLALLQIASKQKIEECEELQGRLKASRSRVADLEREVNALKNEKLQHDNFGKENSSELEKLRKDCQSLRDEKEEVYQDLLEAREKIKNSSDSTLQLQQQIADLSNQLSLATIKIQQLSVGQSLDGQSDQHLAAITAAYEKKINDLNEQIKLLTSDRDESSVQYQQYVQQLNTQMSNLATRIEDLQKVNESLQNQEQNRIKHIGELEMQLQHLKSEQMTFSTVKHQPVEKSDQIQLDEANERLDTLKKANEELEEAKSRIEGEKEQIYQELQAKNHSIAQLEELVTELRSNQPDNAKLLAIMESDKVAAARAVSQNTELKNQLDSMQEVLMKLNNDKVEWTEKLTIEQKNSKDLFEKLQKTEIHLQTLATAIEVKDKELSHLREKTLELNKQVLQDEQLTDRLRHYEAHDHSSHCLQTELQEANQQIAKLTSELTKLKEDKMVEEVVSCEKKPNVNELEEKFKQLEIEYKKLEAKLLENNVQNGGVIDTNHNDNVLDKETAMKQLEEKFLKTMKEVADLTEEKQKLEHLVMQLQGETETIGEYVALYQQQRTILKQKALEKDQQLSQLADDREKIKEKLDQLNELIRKLVLENGSVPKELLEHHEQMQNEKGAMCEEHAKIHNEINRMSQNSVNENQDDKEKNSETAEKIIALLSEIKSSNLVQPSENIHHCPWCSGQLITV